MATGQDFRKQDDVLLAAKIAKRLNVKDGKLHLGTTPINITLPGEPGEPGKTPVKGKDYRDGEDGIGKPPKHQWDGTKIRFQNPDGTWGKWVDLKGKEGEPGTTPKKDVDYRDGEDGNDGVGCSPAHQWKGTRIRFQNPDETWGEWVDLKGEKGDSIKGDPGGLPEHEWMGSHLRIKKPDGTWDKWVNLKGEPGRGKPGENAKKPVKGVDYKDGEPGPPAVLPEAESILILLDANLIVGPTGKAALEKTFQNIKVLKV